MDENDQTPDQPNAEAPRDESRAPGEGERIAKVLSRAGVASRRDAERLILEGRVAVNGEVVTNPATNVTPKDRLSVDGDLVGAPEDTRLWLYHKPAGLVTTEHDEEGRPTVFDDLPEDMPRVMSVGRLDLTSEGLLLLTNDGEVKRRLELPSTGWSRRYRVRINGRPTDEELEPLRQGITVEGMEYQPMEVVIDRQQGANAWLTVTLHEGKNREIRRVMEHLGFSVNRLIRISYGPFQLGDLPVGDVEEVRPKVVRDQLGLGKKAEPVTRARKPRRDEDGIPVFDAEPEARSDDRPAREVLATPRPEGARVRREVKSRDPKPRADRDDRHDDAPRPRTPRGPRKEPVASAFAKPRTYMRVDEDRARAAARAEAEASGEDRPRSSGYKSHGPRREGGEERPRSAGFRSHRDEGDRPARPYKPRDGGDRPQRGFRDRPEGERGPRRDDGDRPQRPYKPRAEGDRPYRSRDDGDRSARPYKPREEGDRKPRWSGGDRPERPARAEGDRPYRPREDGDRPARPYKPRAEGDRPSRPYKPREEGDRPYRSRGEGDRPARPYKPREEGDRPSRPYKPREEGDRPARGFKPARPERSGDRPARSFGPRDGDAPRGPRGDRPPRSGGPGGPRKGPPRSGGPSGPRGPKPPRRG